MWLLWTQHWCGIVDITTCSQLSIIQYVGLYFQFTHFACDNWQNIYILCFIIIIKSEVWTITHCLGLGNETMVCAVCLSVFLQHGWCGCRYRDSNSAWKIMDRFAQCKVIWKFTYICVYSLRRFSDTGIIMTSQRCCHARDSQNQAQIFYNARFAAACLGNSLAEFGFVVYENELIHVIIGFKHDIPRVWISLTKASDGKLWGFIWSAHEQTVDQTIRTLLICDAIALIMMSLYRVVILCAPLNPT